MTGPARRRRDGSGTGTLALLGLGALAFLAWRWPSGDGPTDVAPEQGGSPAHLAPARIAPAATDASGAAAPAPDREAVVAAPGTPPTTGEWTVQLAGIDPAVPWTAPVRLVVEQRFEIRGMPDARGTWRFVPPEAARNPSFQNLVLVAEDDHYRVAQPRQRTDNLQHSGQQEFVVFPIAHLRGRVLAPDGRGTVARVSAFVFGPDGPGGPVVAATDSGPDGSYRLRVPPATPLFLLAEAMHAATLPLLAAPPSPSLLEPPPASADDRALPDARAPRSDLLPAGHRAEGARATPLTVPDLRLGAPAVLTGRATLPDGRPLAGADVVATPSAATAPPWRRELHWSPSGGLVPGARSRTDTRGAFVLQLPAGVPFQVQATAEDPLLLAGEPGTAGTAPGHVELQAPGDLVTVRVVADGRPVPQARIDVGELPPLLANAAGEHRITLGPRSLAVRARADLRASVWVELPPGARPAVVTLELPAAEPAGLAEVRLVLRSQPDLLAATFTWQPLPNGAPLVIAGERQGGDAPFVLRVPAGRHHLTVRDRPGAPGGEYLLPLQLQFDVPPAGLTATHDVGFGGRVQLDVHDANGIRPLGTFTLVDAGGRDVTPRTIVYDDEGAARIERAGVLQPGHVNHLAAVLPPGEYTLTVATEDRGSERLTVTVRRGTTSTATVRRR